MEHIAQVRKLLGQKWDLIIDPGLKLSIQSLRKVVNCLDPVDYTWVPATQLCAKTLECDCEFDVDTHLVEFGTDLMEFSDVNLVGILVRR
jgi:hypothetical protein